MSKDIIEWPEDENFAIEYIEETVRDHPMRCIEIVGYHAGSLCNLLDDQGEEPAWLLEFAKKTQQRIHGA